MWKDHSSLRPCNNNLLVGHITDLLRDWVTRVAVSETLRLEAFNRGMERFFLSRPLKENCYRVSLFSNPA